MLIYALIAIFLVILIFLIWLFKSIMDESFDEIKKSVDREMDHK